MDQITSFLKRFKRPHIETREAFCRITRNITGVDISVEKTKYKNGDIFISLGATEKAQVILYSEKIIEELKKEELKEVVKSIR